MIDFEEFRDMVEPKESEEPAEQQVHEDVLKCSVVTIDDSV